MIQELLGGNSLIAGERKSSINGGGVLLPPTLSPCSLPSSTTSVITTSTTTASSNSENQNLRCPRCDSSNTKFCYYNNYNLTQPRHFCKTCRRYWTKGGALRNVPIGGGCRKNKSITVSSSATKTNTTKMKTMASELETLGRSGLGPGFEHDLPGPSPVLWGSPHNTYLMSLFRESQNQNPNPSPNLMSITVKEEGNYNILGSHSHHMLVEPLVYDTVGAHVPSSLGLCSSFWRNNQDQPQQQNGSGFVLGEHQNSGIQELYQKLRLSSSSSANYCSDNNLPVFLGHNMGSNTSSISNTLEPSSVSGAELGYWNNPTLSNLCSDLPTTNGAYP